MIGLVLATSLAVSVPMRVVHHLPFIRASVGNTSSWFLVDTGTDPSIVDITLARRLNLTLSAPGAGAGGGTGKALFSNTRLPTVSVGAFSEDNVESLSADLSSIGKRLGFPVGGVLGYSFLRGHAVQFDYRHMRLRIWPNGSSAPSSTCTYAMRFTYNDDVLVSALVNGQRAIADLDTGSTGSLAFTPAAIERMNLGADAEHARSSSAQGYNGRYVARTGQVKQFAIGPKTWTGVAAMFWQPHTGHDGKPFDVNVGSTLLSSVSPVFDYVHHLVYFNVCP